MTIKVNVEHHHDAELRWRTLRPYAAVGATTKCRQVAEGLLQQQDINVTDVNGDHTPHYYDVLVYRENGRGLAHRVDVQGVEPRAWCVDLLSPTPTWRCEGDRKVATQEGGITPRDVTQATRPGELELHAGLCSRSLGNCHQVFV
jgi:hypothetical protein